MTERDDATTRDAIEHAASGPVDPFGEMLADAPVDPTVHARTDAVALGDPEERSELLALAAESALDARSYLATVTEVASGQVADRAIPLLLLATAQLLRTGSRLGAIQDIVPVERFENDSGPDPDLDPLLASLTNLFEGLDDYADVVDPVTQAELTRGSLSNDIVYVVAALTHGLSHYDAGRPVEALWWWQFSYLSTWGDRAASSLRVLQSVLAHLRLDADDEVVSAAEFDALHP